VLINSRLKEAIERQDLSQILPKDADELHSLLELGFIEKESLE
jgi:hypothetical protein